MAVVSNALIVLFIAFLLEYNNIPFKLKSAVYKAIHRYSGSRPRFARAPLPTPYEYTPVFESNLPESPCPVHPENILQNSIFSKAGTITPWIASNATLTPAGLKLEPHSMLSYSITGLNSIALYTDPSFFLSFYISGDLGCNATYFVGGKKKSGISLWDKDENGQLHVLQQYSNLNDSIVLSFENGFCQLVFDYVEFAYNCAEQDISKNDRNWGVANEEL